MPLHIRRLGLSGYEDTWHAMQHFTASRGADTPDELWLTEHAPIYTLGLNRRDATPPLRSDIPLLPVDRGGKITYHGPGQVVIYLLLDLGRRNWTIRHVVDAMENSIVALLAEHAIEAHARADAPGVYIGEAKIASLGLRIKQQRCYHGLALNVDMDLAPFSAIDPCGYKGMPVTQTRDLGLPLTPAQAGERLLKLLAGKLGYTENEFLRTEAL
ncbi:lipoyl(octanoyl) transferase LipB [Methylovorus mays]|uniref:lipoyl(octanoyl) transferase LipB n=1 Tax=Methylovorus mays TaxID=184077 RepID=UPI001E2B338A|nr:lipoyl(octanoyl) transferase LipB [Methylovorus mays]MCB5208062.1 lipoyl(octanoyl) transferase LipB [Methylovorus mays]